MQLNGTGMVGAGAVGFRAVLDINSDNAARAKKNNNINNNPKVSGPYRVEAPGTKAMRALQAYASHNEQAAEHAHKMADMFGINVYV